MKGLAGVFDGDLGDLHIGGIGVLRNGFGSGSGAGVLAAYEDESENEREEECSHT